MPFGEAHVTAMLLDKLLSSAFQSAETFALISVMSRFATEYTDDFIYLVTWLLEVCHVASKQ